MGEAVYNTCSLSSHTAHTHSVQEIEICDRIIYNFLFTIVPAGGPQEGRAGPAGPEEHEEVQPERGVT